MVAKHYLLNQRADRLAAVKQAVALRMRFTPRILELAQADDGTLITGPVQKNVSVPLGRLLYFERQ